MMKAFSLLIAAMACAFGTQVFADLPSTSAFNVRLDYSVAHVTPSAPHTLVSSTPFAVSQITVFDSSGQTMELISSKSGRVTYIYIPPGGGDFPLTITAGSQIQIIGISGTASSGEDDINFFY